MLEPVEEKVRLSSFSLFVICRRSDRSSEKGGDERD